MKFKTLPAALLAFVGGMASVMSPSIVSAQTMCEPIRQIDAASAEKFAAVKSISLPGASECEVDSNAEYWCIWKKAVLNNPRQQQAMLTKEVRTCLPQARVDVLSDDITKFETEKTEFIVALKNEWLYFSAESKPPVTQKP